MGVEVGNLKKHTPNNTPVLYIETKKKHVFLIFSMPTPLARGYRKQDSPPHISFHVSSMIVSDPFQRSSRSTNLSNRTPRILHREKESMAPTYLPPPSHLGLGWVHLGPREPNPPEGEPRVQPNSLAGGQPIAFFQPATFGPPVAGLPALPTACSV